MKVQVVLERFSCMAFTSTVRQKHFYGTCKTPQLIKNGSQTIRNRDITQNLRIFCSFRQSKQHLASFWSTCLIIMILGGTCMTAQNYHFCCQDVISEPITWIDSHALPIDVWAGRKSKFLKILNSVYHFICKSMLTLILLGAVYSFHAGHASTIPAWQNCESCF